MENTWDRPNVACYDSGTVPDKRAATRQFNTHNYMQEFYKKTLLALIFLLVADALLAVFFV